jgi:hypothetical protein
MIDKMIMYGELEGNGNVTVIIFSKYYRSIRLGELALLAS